MAEFVMPSLGADMSAGTLVAWKKSPGDRVTRGEIIAEVETEKAMIEVESFTTGVIEKFLVEPGEQVPVGTPMAIIREDGKPIATGPTVPASEGVAPLSAHLSSGSLSAEAPPSAAAPLRPRVTPLARQVAAKLGVDLSKVQGSGSGGAIRSEDVERAAAAGATSQVSIGGPTDRQAKMRQAIASAMSRSKREIPHYYLSTRIDMRLAMSWLTDTNLKRPVPERLLAGVLLIKAVALALREVPELNAVWEGGRVVQRSDIHVGVAISLRQGGLVAPALHNTDCLGLEELMRNFKDLVKRARAFSLRSSELAEPTITVTNLGEQGVEAGFAIIYPPQVAIVGFGKIVERPWIVGGVIVPCPVVTATLSGDHRVTDGHRGGLFLSAVERLLQDPERL